MQKEPKTEILKLRPLEFSSIKDDVEKVLDNGAQYKGLSWKMTSKKPFKTP